MNSHNIKIFYPQHPSHLLKVTKFLVKILKFKFKFLVMTEKNIFVYNLFLSLNISDFSLFLYKNSNILCKRPPSFPVSSSKNWVPVKPTWPFRKFGKRSTPQYKEGGNAHYEKTQWNTKSLWSKVWLPNTKKQYKYVSSASWVVHIRDFLYSSNYSFMNKQLI